MRFHLRLIAHYLRYYCYKQKDCSSVVGEPSAASIPAIRDARERLVLKTFQREKYF